ncbi:AAA family ATPase [Methylocystis sp.]|uniref:AAA family ATPase n=1 Tax=Methylocystis sp. TaxID=1911079 RepID=UPI0025F47BCE|nr:AAA family ATPase [Methylocystis sp.]
MLSKINRIKNLGLVFADFSWSPATPSFQAFNLIYGWNGCGKTTLTRLFGAAASGERLDELEYVIEDSAGSVFSESDRFPFPVRVFNQDYIQRNVRVLESSANSISILLGEDNKKLAAQIEQDDLLLNGDPRDRNKIGKIRELKAIEEKARQEERRNETAFTEIAKTIGAAVAGSLAASRTYRAPDAKKDFAQMSEPELLTDEQREAHVLALKQEMLADVEQLSLPDMDYGGRRNSILPVARDICDQARRLSGITVESEILHRLAENPDISEWIETGLSIRSRHNSASCEFCGNLISAERLAQLARHFSDSDRKLKREIDDVLISLREVHRILSNFSAPDPARLYRELQSSYESALARVEAARSTLLKQIEALGRALQDKKLRTTEALTFDLSIDTNPLGNAIKATIDVIDLHNAKSRDFLGVQQKSVQALKHHYLSTIYDDVTKRNLVLSGLSAELSLRKAEITEIQGRIADARSKISSDHAACEQINSGLRTFLGRPELSFIPETLEAGSADDETNKIVGYRIMRADSPALHLSEGEKTAIAFVYFVVHLGDGHFSKRDGIVVIDDPISSLDSNSLYQAFSFLKNAVSSCRQVFVFTHNFEFLKLLLNWRKNAGGARYLMIKNYVDGNQRRAVIEEMDRELWKYESEYHYLFGKLKEMRAEQDGSITRAYPVPNIARKVWDSFLMFRVPSGENPYKKMEQLKSEGFSAEKLDAIYKFCNDQSHITGGGFDPALIPETQNVLATLFEIMKEISPEHFAILDKATDPSASR